jgi:site-specific DNA recombinase
VAIERALILEFEAVRQEAEQERTRLLKRQQRLLAERDKLLQAHYAEAIPLDLLKTEQDRIRNSLGQVSDRLSGTDTQYNTCEATLVASLKFLEDGHGTYLGADPILRRQINQALFKRIRIERNGGVRADLTEPFSSLLSPAIRDLVATRVGDEALQWRAWEDSINDNTHGDLPVGVGLTYESLVGVTGLEPVTWWLYVMAYVLRVTGSAEPGPMSRIIEAAGS